MTLSVLTIVKNRAAHLANLALGLERSEIRPAELVIVDMASDEPIGVGDLRFPVRVVRMDDVHLPLGAARNLAALTAVGEHLLFLDVDCIPSAKLVGAMDRALSDQSALICADVQYLEPDALQNGWTEEWLEAHSAPHPVREFPVRGFRRETNAGLFWSLAFGLSARNFAELGGFDENFTGYGAEDTDFGYRAVASGLPLLFMGGIPAFHQHHESYDPPLNHFADIVRNAQLFHDRWNIWPMDGWLAAFSDMGLIRQDTGRLTMLRYPDARELALARKSATC